VASCLSVAAGALLTWFAIDATVVNTHFIDTLTSAATKWPPHAYKQCARREMSQGDLRDYLDVQLVALRTDVVGRLVYFPLLVMMLLIGSHLTVFDNWSWPPGTVVVYVASAALSVVAARWLRRAAERARQNALARLHERWVCYLGKGEKHGDALQQVMEEVRTESRGAFSFLAQYPVLAGILLPSGGLGAYVLIEYLLRNPS
jgi:Flp pilus assembly protein TadB